MARSSKLSSKKHAFAAALFGLVTTASGIISTVLFYYFLANFDDNSIIHTPPQLHFWWTPVPFIVPGILGIAAAVVRKKLLFAFYLAVAIMTLLVTGVFLVIVLVFVVDLPSEYSPAHCKVQQGQCYCQRELKDIFEQATGYADCDAMFQMLVYGHVGTGIYVLGWGLCFAGALLSCITCNYIERRRARDIVAYSTRHSPSIKVSTVQPPDRRQAGAINVAYVYS